LCDDETFVVDETWLPHAASRASQALCMPCSGRLRVDQQQERAMIEAALAESRGRVSGPSGAASKLGIPRQTLESKIKRFGINKHRLTSA
jgi:formate hydrogenlyase transcriptional activator